MHIIMEMHRQINNNKRCEATETSVLRKYDAEAPLVPPFFWCRTLSSCHFNVEMFFVVIDVTCHGHILHVLRRTICQSRDFLNITIYCSWLKIKSEFLIDQSHAERHQKWWAFVWAPSLSHLKSGPLLLGGHTPVFAACVCVWLITEMMND